jgi:PhnB protein
MATHLNPYINFTEGNAREALEFYHGVFGGELNISKFGDFGPPDPQHTVPADGVMHGQLETGSGFTLMASDTPPEFGVVRGTNVSISLSGDVGDELRGYWEKLSDGATVTVPLQKQVWGDEFGTLTDRFGIQWMVNISGQAQG